MIRRKFAPARRAAGIALSCALAAASAACTTIGPKPWEKDLMAKREMQVDPYPLQTATDEHVYFSKEASSGGRGFAGGGCGCN
jgi:hypothetical protein